MKKYVKILRSFSFYIAIKYRPRSFGTPFPDVIGWIPWVHK